MFKQVVSVTELEDEVRNAGEETQVVIGFLKCSQRNWFRYLHDYHYMLNQIGSYYLWSKYAHFFDD